LSRIPLLMDQRDASTAAALYRLALQSSLAQGFAGGALVFGQPAVMFCEAVVLITTLLTRALLAAAPSPRAVLAAAAISVAHAVIAFVVPSTVGSTAGG